MADYIYYDLNIQNTTNTDKEIIFDERRTSNIMSHANDYYCSIVRFVLDTRNLPVFVPLMKENDALNTQYEIIFDGTNYPVQHKCSDESLTAPTSFISSYDEPYFYYYNYNAVIDIFNTTFKNIHGNNTGDPITMSIDSDLFVSLNIPSFYSTKNIIFNNQMGNLFSLFNLVKTTDNQFKITFPTITSTLVLKTQNAMSYNLSPVDTVQFISSRIPVAGTLTTSKGKNKKFSNDSELVLTDFISTQLSPETLYTPVFLYVPEVYRFQDLITNTPISNIEFKVQWKDISGSVHPLTIKPNGYSSIKIMFKRKNIK